MVVKRLLTLIIQDADGDTSSVSVYVGESQGGGDQTESYYFGVLLRPLWLAIKPLINGVLVDARVTISYGLDDFFNSTYDVYSDVQEKCQFLFMTSPPRHLVQINLPTIKESIFSGSGASKEVDRTNSDVQAFIVLMTEDVTNGGINATDSHGQDISLISDAKQVFRG